MEVVRNGFGNTVYCVHTWEEISDASIELKKNQSRFLSDIKHNNLLYISKLYNLCDKRRSNNRYAYITCVDYCGNNYSVLLFGIIGRLGETLKSSPSIYDIMTTLKYKIQANLNVSYNIYNKTIKNMLEGYGVNEFNNISSAIKHKIELEKIKKQEEERRKREEARIKSEERKRAENEAFKLSLVNRFNPNMSINDFIIKVKNPCIERELGNNNKNTFDFITLEMLTPLKFYGDRKKYIKDHLKEIYKIAMDKISNYKYYQKYDVPVNYLKLTNLTISCENTLVFKFGIKGESKEAS